MTRTLHCICLRVTRHSDTVSLATLWSRECGRITASVSAGAGAGARRQRALMMPMGLVEGVADIRPGAEVVRLRDLRPYLCGNPAAGDPAKSVTALFLCDFLSAVLRQTPPDPNLTDFIFHSARVLGSLPQAPNFHLVFLYRLSHFLGIQPDTTEYRRGMLLDMRDGVYRATVPAHRDVLTDDAARLSHTLSLTDYENMHRLPLTRRMRNDALDTILRYYSLHLGPLSLPSLEVARSIFQ